MKRGGGGGEGEGEENSQKKRMWLCFTTYLRLSFTSWFMIAVSIVELSTLAD